MKEQKIYRMEIRCQNGKEIIDSFPAGAGEIEKDGAIIRLEEHCEGQVRFLTLDLNLKDDRSWANNGLCKDDPVLFYLPTEAPKKIVAMYMLNEWWTRPAFADRFDQIPMLTQVLYLQYEDRCECIVPMVGQEWKVLAGGGTDTEICLRASARMGGLQELHETLYAAGEGKTLGEAVHAVFTWIAREKGIRTREERRIPEMFRYLGWCSWDAFYTKVNEAGIRGKAAELSVKSVPVRWMLIDDGWMSSEGRFLTDYSPDQVKFPSAFRPMIQDIRALGKVRWFGVWHAFGGYWGGVKLGSEAAAKAAPYLRKTVNGDLVPDTENGAGFYRNWYDYLQSEDIEFVKVDGQSASSIYYENTVPTAAAARGMNKALESGVSRMDNAVINCMGMAMENILARPVTAISRNSDDFMPKREGGFAEHLLQNAYNTFYHNEIYCCDWDMFWTSHPDCRKHSLLRAVSGGPVYFSDRVGETDLEVLKPLCYTDGRLLMLNRSARPTEDCIFTDPVKEGVLKLQNVGCHEGNSIAGGIAVYNLTDRTQEYAFTPADIPDLPEAEKYLVFDYFGKKAVVIGKTESCSGTLNRDEYGWFVILPVHTKTVFVGLSEKYAGFTAVESVYETADRAVAVLTECGTAAWMSEKDPVRVERNGEDVTAMIRKIGGLYFLEGEEKPGKMVLSVIY